MCSRIQNKDLDNKKKKIEKTTILEKKNDLDRGKEKESATD